MSQPSNDWWRTSVIEGDGIDADDRLEIYGETLDAETIAMIESWTENHG